jgi:hypothetical protein
VSVINYTKAIEECKVRRSTFGKYVYSIQVNIFTLFLYKKGNIGADQATKNAYLISSSNREQRGHSLFIGQLEESSDKH